LRALPLSTTWRARTARGLRRSRRFDRVWAVCERSDCGLSCTYGPAPGAAWAGLARGVRGGAPPALRTGSGGVVTAPPALRTGSGGVVTARGRLSEQVQKLEQNTERKRGGALSGEEVGGCTGRRLRTISSVLMSRLLPPRCLLARRAPVWRGPPWGPPACVGALKPPLLCGAQRSTRPDSRHQRTDTAFGGSIWRGLGECGDRGRVAGTALALCGSSGSSCVLGAAYTCVFSGWAQGCPKDILELRDQWGRRPCRAVEC
jgi:hypothetical protein